MNTTFSALAPLAIDQKIIQGVSVITEGPARGHGLTVDQTTLAQVIQCARTRAVKVKMMHDSDLSQVVGTLKNFRIEGPQVLADLHLLQSSPARDFILEIAATMPTAFGLSISFEGTPEGTFARCAKLLSVDLVDEPAANPTGLFEEKPLDAPKDDGTTDPQQLATMPDQPAPEDKIAMLESALATMGEQLAKIAASVESLLAEEKAEVEPVVEMGKKEEPMDGSFAAIEEKLVSAFEAKFEALAALVKSAGAPAAPGVQPDAAPETKLSFSDLQKDPAAYRAHLIKLGIFKS